MWSNLDRAEWWATTPTSHAHSHAGITIDGDVIRALGLRRGRPVWAASAPVRNGIGASLATLLAIARSRLGRVSPVGMAIGPAFATVTRYDAATSVPPTAVASRVVVRGKADWVATYGREALEELQRTCAAARVEVRAIMPVVDVVARGLASVYDDTVPWPPQSPLVAAAYGAAESDAAFGESGVLSPGTA